MRLKWPKREVARQGETVQEHSPVKEDAPAIPAKVEDVVALLNQNRSAWSLDRDDGYIALEGEIYNPTDQWLTYVEALVTFSRGPKEGGARYVYAARLLELRVNVPPRESRPFRIIPEPRIDGGQFSQEGIWDYEVTRAEVTLPQLPKMPDEG